MDELAHFLRARNAYRATLHTELSLIDVCGGDVLGGIMLSVVLDEYERHTAAGTLVMKDRRNWVPMRWRQWWQVTRIKEEVGRRALTRLEKAGLIRTRTMLVLPPHGRSLCISINSAHLLQSWNAVLSGNAPLMLEPGE